MKRVVVGLSGGVDSSVAAYLLQQEGYEVIGLFMKNWHDTSVTISNECPWVEDSSDAMSVAETLNIPYQTIDLSKEYKERIVDYMFAEYQKGRTPNPDILCNREIKFDIFLKAAMQLNADYVATGHYCRKEIINLDGKEIFQLKAPTKRLIIHLKKNKIIKLKWLILNLQSMKNLAKLMDEDHKAKNDLSRQRKTPTKNLLFFFHFPSIK